MKILESLPQSSYYYQKDERYPISNKSLPELFEEAAGRENQNYVTWHRPAERYTYRELYERAQMVAKGLIAAGLKRGDCVMGVGCQGSDGVVMFMASVSIGLIFCCPHLYTPASKTLPAIIRKTQPKLILVGDVTDAGGFYTRTFMTLNDWLQAQSHTGKTIPLVYYDSISENSEECMRYNMFARPITSLIEHGFSISDSTLEKEKLATDINSPCFYALSSGSTGEQKTIVLGANYFINSTYLEDRLEFTKESVVYGMQNMVNDDLYLCFGLVAAAKIGYACVIVPSPNQHEEEEVIQEMCECVQQHRITFMDVELCYTRSITLNLSLRAKYDLSSITGWVLSAAPISENRKRQILIDFPQTVDCLGLSELYYVTCPLPGYNIKKPGSIGRPLINIETKVCDEDGNIVDCGQEGELLVKSPGLFLNYKNQPDLTNSMFTEDGFYKTGDCVRMDEEGDLFFISRMSKTERYKVWADVVYAAPIEHVLNRHPKIKECCVIGIPAEKIDSASEICYCIVLNKGETLTMDEVSSYSYENMRDQREWPMRIIFMDKLPREGARMKVMKLKLIDDLEKEVKQDNSLYAVTHNYNNNDHTSKQFI